MKKILSILMLLVAIVTGAWADQTYHTVTPNVENTQYEMYALYSMYSSKAVKSDYSAWVSGSVDNQSSSSYTAPSGWLDGGSGKPGYGFLQVKDTKTITFYITNCVGVVMLSKSGGSSRYCQLSVKDADTGIEVSTVKQNGNTLQATDYETPLTPTKNYIVTLSGTGDQNQNFYQIRFEAPSAPSGKTATTTTITSDSKSALDLDLKNGTSAGTLAATVVSGDPATAVEGATVSWESSNTGVAEIDEESGAVTLKATGTTTLKATYAGNETYDGSNDTYQITVTDTRTALTASWDNAAPVFTIDEAATNPEFTVTGGEAVLDTDYEVAYTKVSGDDLATIDETGGITAINTSAAGTETIKATVTVTSDAYKIATTEYNCVITVANTHSLSFNANGGSGSMEGIIGYGEVKLPKNLFTKSGYTFMGWATSQASATAGTVAYADEAAYTLNEDATIYAVWAVTDIYLVPATSGDAPASGNDINMQSSSFGGSMKALSANLSYTASGLQFGKDSGTKASVTLDRNLKAGSVIVMTLVAGGDKARGLKLYNADGSSQITTIGWTSSDSEKNGDVKTFYYEVKATDTGLIGSNGFQLWRNNTVILTNLSIVDAAEPVKVELNNVAGFNYGFAGFCAPKNFSVTNGTAYKAVVTDGKMVLKSLDGIVPADKGVVIAGTKGATATITYTTDEATADVTDNDLLGTTERTLTSELKGSAAKFLTLQKSTSKFIQYTGTYFPAYKAYLLLDSNTQSLDLVFDNPTAINGVAETEAKAAPVKVIKNGKLFIGNYNVAGQLVK